MKYLILIAPILMWANTCYSIDKQYLISNLTRNENVMIRLPDILSKDFEAEVSFDTSRDIKGAVNGEFFCSVNDGYYACGVIGDEHQVMELKKEGDAVYVLLSYAKLSSRTNTEFLYYSKAKTKAFIKTQRTDCIKDVDAIVYIEREDAIQRSAIKSLKKMNNLLIYGIDRYKNTLFAVGRDYSKETRAKYEKSGYVKYVSLYSDDGGKTWEKSYTEKYPLEKVVALSERKAIAVGVNFMTNASFITMTNDSGKTWESVHRGEWFGGIARTSQGIFAVGDAIWYSENGIKWKKVFTAKYIALHTIKEIDRSLLIAVGYNEICTSTDGGKHWDIYDTSVSMEGTEWTGMHEENSTIYVTTNFPDEMLFSKDRGQSWSMLESRSSPKQ